MLIGGFGFLGTIARYLTQGAVQRLTGGTFPYGTLAVNVIGSLVEGGMVTLERVQVITYRPGKDQGEG